MKVASRSGRHDNLAGSRYCASCGVKLAPAHTVVEGNGREGERRQLTVMFCDLVDSTGLGERLDPEELRDVLDTYEDTCSRIVEKFDGHIVDPETGLPKLLMKLVEGQTLGALLQETRVPPSGARLERLLGGRRVASVRAVTDVMALAFHTASAGTGDPSWVRAFVEAGIERFAELDEMQRHK